MTPVVKIFGLLSLIFAHSSSRSLSESDEMSKCKVNESIEWSAVMSLHELHTKAIAEGFVLPSNDVPKVIDAEKGNELLLAPGSEHKRKTPSNVTAERPLKRRKWCADSPCYLKSKVAQRRSLITSKICTAYRRSHPYRVLPTKLYLVDFFYQLESSFPTETFFAKFSRCLGVVNDFGSGPKALFTSQTEAVRASRHFRTYRKYPNGTVIEICNCKRA